MDAKRKEKSPVAKKNLFKAAALGIMFTLGTSAFADNGSLFSKSGVTYDDKAVQDIVSIIEYSSDCSKDGIVDDVEKENIKLAKAGFDKKYGEGACKFIVSEIMDYSKTPGGIGIMQQTDYKKGLEIMADRAVEKGAQQQKVMQNFNMTLNDYEFGR